MIEYENYWLLYQEKWLADRSRIKIWEKSRRIGATYVQAWEDVYDCVTFEHGKPGNSLPESNPDVWFASQDEDSAKEYIEYCEDFAKIINKLYGHTLCDEKFEKIIDEDNEEYFVIDEKREITVSRLRFKNGTKITALSSSPRRFRGKGGRIVLDEFAHHEDAFELIKSALPCASLGGSIRILSTHHGINSAFNEYVKTIRAGKIPKATVHKTTIHDAVNDGIVEVIVNGRNKQNYTREEWLEERKTEAQAMGGEKVWLEEFCCDPRADIDNLVVKNFTTDNLRPIPYLPFLLDSGGNRIEIDLHLSCDFNVSPNCWILSHIDREKKMVYYFKEYCLDLYTEDLIKIVLDEHKHPSRIIINGDASGYQRGSSSSKTDYALIENELIKRGYKKDKSGIGGKRYKFEVDDGNPSRQDRFKSFNIGINDINNVRRILIDPEGCPMLVYNCEELALIPGSNKYDLPTAKQIEKQPKLKYKGHAIDNAQYLYYKYFPIKRDKTIEEKNKSLLERWRDQM